MAVRLKQSKDSLRAYSKAMTLCARPTRCRTCWRRAHAQTRIHRVWIRESIHHKLKRSGQLRDIGAALHTRLVDLYSACDHVELAERALEEISEAERNWRRVCTRTLSDTASCAATPFCFRGCSSFTGARATWRGGSGACPNVIAWQGAAAAQ